MSLRPDPTDPTSMRPDERRDELAAILARGVLRRQRPLTETFDSIEIPPASLPFGLELSAAPWPDGVARLTTGERR